MSRAKSLHRSGSRASLLTDQSLAAPVPLDIRLTAAPYIPAEFIGVEWLDDDGIDQLRIERREYGLIERCHDDERARPVRGMFLQPRDDLPAVHTRHHEVEKNDSITPAFELFNRMRAVRDRRDGKALALQGDRDEIS